MKFYFWKAEGDDTNITQCDINVYLMIEYSYSVTLHFLFKSPGDPGKPYILNSFWYLIYLLVIISKEGHFTYEYNYKVNYTTDKDILFVFFTHHTPFM